MVKLKFIIDGQEKEVQAQEGQSILDVCREHDIPLEGSCEGSLSCSTCHVYIDKSFFNKLETASETEEDILDIASGVQANSRLGCQVIVTKDLDGMLITLPK